MTEFLKFSKDWNKKLSCDVFTTVRLKSEKYKQKKEFYVLLVNEKGAVRKEVGRYKIMMIFEFLLKDITEFIALLDVGESKQSFQKTIKEIYKKKPIDWDTQKLQLLVLKKSNYEMY